ncbi:hypothetical protein, partial [Phocaeicola vulgatus]
AFDFIITWRETRTRPNAYFYMTYLQCKDKVCHLSVQSHDIGILDSQTSLFIAIINESRKGIYQNHYL